MCLIALAVMVYSVCQANVCPLGCNMLLFRALVKVLAIYDDFNCSQLTWGIEKGYDHSVSYSWDSQSHRHCRYRSCEDDGPEALI